MIVIEVWMEALGALLTSSQSVCGEIIVFRWSKIAKLNGNDQPFLVIIIFKNFISL